MVKHWKVSNGLRVKYPNIVTEKFKHMLQNWKKVYITIINSIRFFQRTITYYDVKPNLLEEEERQNWYPKYIIFQPKLTKKFERTFQECEDSTLAKFPQRYINKELIMC